MVFGSSLPHALPGGQVTCAGKGKVLLPKLVGCGHIAIGIAISLHKTQAWKRDMIGEEWHPPICQFCQHPTTGFGRLQRVAIESGGPVRLLERKDVMQQNVAGNGNRADAGFNLVAEMAGRVAKGVYGPDTTKHFLAALDEGDAIAKGGRLSVRGGMALAQSVPSSGVAAAVASLPASVFCQINSIIEVRRSDCSRSNLPKTEANHSACSSNTERARSIPLSVSWMVTLPVGAGPVHADCSILPTTDGRSEGTISGSYGFQ